ncbi:MAG: VWA domain-containing protein [Candidatus Solibacter usitatus]|nr:VWA domain-containing protein [Candidatus Solibacter usitatus]
MPRIDFALAPAAFLAAGLVLAGSGPTPSAQRREAQSALPGDVTEGSLIRTDPYGSHTGERCPLKHTAVDASISGFLARVTVTQEFENNSPDRIEAVYTFPLPRLAAVDDMTMVVASRTIKAEIKRRDEARRIFEQARNQGRTAALLEQQRPNIFTQSVTNIDPGAKVRVTISYVETLKYEEGAYEFSFPMTVGPRYTPASMNPADAQAIVPKYAPPETRAGHDLSLSVKLDAGVPIDALTSKTHEVDVQRPSSHQAVLALKQKAVVPNKDFILRYDVAGARIEDALLTHNADRGGFFTLILQPPERVTTEDVTPKELVFVIDTSGSMSGFPIEKAKETMRLALAGLYPRDTFNLITFSGDTHLLFPQPVPATSANLEAAQQFLAGRRGGGGTEMMKAVRAALAPSPDDTGKIRIVCFMTDGYVGNEAEIIAEVKRHSEARVFSFGIGSSVNRYLLDKMAEEGRGEVEYVGLNDDGSAAARRFHERVRNPLLTGVTVDWGGLAVSGVYPKRIPDLFSARPVVIHGRYLSPGSGAVVLRGSMSGRPFTRTLRVELPARQPANDVLATLWARSRVEDLMHLNPNAPDEAEVTRLGLAFRLMTQYTSFVAVEERTEIRNGQPVRIQVPVEMPEGVSHEGVFGRQDAAMGGPVARKMALNMPAASPSFVAQESIAIPKIEDRRAPEWDRHENKLDARLTALAASASDSSQRVEVEIWLTEATAEVLDALKKLGFEHTLPPKVAKIRTGRIRIDRLAALARLKEVLAVRAK